MWPSLPCTPATVSHFPLSLACWESRLSSPPQIRSSQLPLAGTHAWSLRLWMKFPRKQRQWQVQHRVLLESRTEDRRGREGRKLTWQMSFLPCPVRRSPAKLPKNSVAELPNPTGVWAGAEGLGLCVLHLWIIEGTLSRMGFWPWMMGSNSEEGIWRGQRSYMQCFQKLPNRKFCIPEDTLAHASCMPFPGCSENKGWNWNWICLDWTKDLPVSHTPH